MFKNRLREAREEYGMSVTILAKRTGVHNMTITDIELNGSVPRGDTMLKICKALKMEVQEIFWIE
jgi:DNA-binding XRE family transcriptional regulator